VLLGAVCCIRSPSSLRFLSRHSYANSGDFFSVAGKSRGWVTGFSTSLSSCAPAPLGNIIWQNGVLNLLTFVGRTPASQRCPQLCLHSVVLMENCSTKVSPLSLSRQILYLEEAKRLH